MKKIDFYIEELSDMEANVNMENKSAELEDSVVVLMRRCGHHLHHNVGKGGTDEHKKLKAE